MKTIKLDKMGKDYWALDWDYSQPDDLGGGFGTLEIWKKLLTEKGYRFLSETNATNGTWQTWGK